MIEAPPGGPRTASAASRSSRTGRRARSGRWGERSLTLVAGLFALFLGLPVLDARRRGRSSTGRSRVALASPAVLDALWLSLVTTAISLVITVVVGSAARDRPGPAARSAARGSSRRSSTCRSCCRRRSPGSPCCSCSVAAACSAAPFEFLGISVPFTTIAVILAMTFVSAPFFIRSARTGIAGVDRDLEDAARVDGASERQLFRSITVPLAGAALAAGLVMTWARSLGEFGATIMFAGNVEGRTQTLPLVVYSEFQGGSLDASIAAAAILVLAAFGVLVAVRVFHWGRVLDVRGIT